mmetsp:Transcript_12276/g.28361  ORF Transcript_12276/g.28361 Transcript_12276/m.28361 type:complete len:317 (-) Transcript_12276:56-1006(-)|eukprot:CAMPEP_0114541804 /NCGR_PEP_ID=MMETSP0114-20121206/1499_1 /TAXON_ID=31324 /ORGANISM="Goniomonas sp, Strain m" /LENGTH=316 /DNA_ID=CAMNT_0001726063 /DNA_START=27 /DNA_END=977 /DNA_ORIENTATION=-
MAQEPVYPVLPPFNPDYVVDAQNVHDPSAVGFAAYAPGMNNAFAGTETQPLPGTATAPMPAPGVAAAPPPQVTVRQGSSGGSSSSGLFGVFNRMDKACASIGDHITEKGLIGSTKEYARKVGVMADVALAGGTDRHFHATFNLPKHEKLLHSYNCSMLFNHTAGSGVTGIVYVSENFISFHSDTLSSLNKGVRDAVGYKSETLSTVIPYYRIATISQANVVGGHRAILIVTQDGFHFCLNAFFSADSFNKCLHEMGTQMLMVAAKRQGHPPPTVPQQLQQPMLYLCASCRNQFQVAPGPRPLTVACPTCHNPNQIA